MTLFKNALKVIALTSTLASASVFASDLVPTTTINDASNDAAGGWVYEIDRMDITWSSSELITVDIFTNFVDYNNEVGTGYRWENGHKISNGNIVLGDLLISTDGTSNYDYAFVLSDADRDRQKYWEQNHWDNTGTLNEISSVVTSKEYHHNSSHVQTGDVMAGTKVDSGVSSNWTVDRQNTGAQHNNFDKISFSFNVGNIQAFQDASQVAFSWAMSCANDVVNGVVDVTRSGKPNGGGGTSVPEPTTLVLMLMGFAFVANSRKKKAKTFTA